MSNNNKQSPLKKRPKWLWWLLALLLLAVAFGIYKMQSAKQNAPTEVLSAPVERGSLEDTVLASGVIQAYKLINVGAQVSGQVKRLHVKLGDTVSQGQLVAEIDSATQNNSLQDAQAALANAQAQKTSKQAQLAKAEADLRQQQVLAKQGFIAESALLAAQTAVKSGRADVAAMDAQIQQYAVRSKTAATNLSYTRIVAPMNGVVVAIVTDEGQTLNANQTTPTIIKLADLSTMTIQAQISEADVPRVHAGMEAWFTILGEPEQRYRATLRGIEPGPIDIASTGAQAAAGTSANAVYYNGLLDVPNPDGKLRISMTAQVSIVLQKIDNALLLPSGALTRSRGAKGAPNGYTVRVLKGDAGEQKIEERAVKIGLNNRVQAQVLEGLQEGERVVVGQAGAAGAPGAKPRGLRMF